MALWWHCHPGPNSNRFHVFFLIWVPSPSCSSMFSALMKPSGTITLSHRGAASGELLSHDRNLSTRKFPRRKWNKGQITDCRRTKYCNGPQPLRGRGSGHVEEGSRWALFGSCCNISSPHCSPRRVLWLRMFFQTTRPLGTLLYQALCQVQPAPV